MVEVAGHRFGDFAAPESCLFAYGTIHGMCCVPDSPFSGASIKRCTALDPAPSHGVCRAVCCGFLKPGDLMKTQLRCRTTATDGKIRQDKLFKLPKTQLRWNRLSTLTSSHSGLPENWI